MNTNLAKHLDFTRTYRRLAAKDQGISEAQATVRMLPPSQAALFRMIVENRAVDEVAPNAAVNVPNNWPAGQEDAASLMTGLETMDILERNEENGSLFLTSIGRAAIGFLFRG